MAQVLGKRIDREERYDAVKIPRRVRKQSRFLFRHHPFRFMFVDGEWLPLLGKLRIDPGVDGVTTGGGIDLAVAGGMRRGWQVIQPSDPRLGPYQDYLVAYPHEAGGSTHLDPFQKVSVEAGRLFVDEGGEEYYKFLRHLISSGIVAPITPNIVKVKTREVERRIERLQGAVSLNPANQIAAGKLRREEATRDQMLKASAPKTPRKPRKKPQEDSSNVG